MTDPASPHDANVPDIIRRIDALMGAKTPAAWMQIAPLLLMDVRVVILSESLARQQAERQVQELDRALRGVMGRTNCCCEYGIGNPNVREHSAACAFAQGVLK